MCVCVCARISQRKLLGGRVRHARVLLLACLACCGPRLSVLLEVRNCRLWPLPGTSSCRRPLRRKRSSGSSTVVCLTWIDAGSTSQSRYFLNIRGVVVVFTGQRLRRIHRAGQSWLARRCARILFCYWTWQVSNVTEISRHGFEEMGRSPEGSDGARARSERSPARSGLCAPKASTSRRRKRSARRRSSEQADKKFAKADKKFEKAKEEAKRAESKAKRPRRRPTKANEELEKAESTAPLQAGDAFALLRAVRAVHQLLLLGVMLSSQQGFRSSLSCFHCVGLQHFGEWPVLRSLSRLRLFLFEARLSGYCVREGESRESTLCSSRLPLAHGPCRAVGFRQDECRPGGLLRGHAFGL